MCCRCLLLHIVSRSLSLHGDRTDGWGTQKGDASSSSQAAAAKNNKSKMLSYYVAFACMQQPPALHQIGGILRLGQEQIGHIIFGIGKRRKKRIMTSTEYTTRRRWIGGRESASSSSLARWWCVIHQPGSLISQEQEKTAQL